MSLTFTQQKKPASSLIPARKGHQDHQTAFQPPKAAEAPLQPGFGHEFGQVDVHSDGRTGQQFASSCPLALPSPRACPFGGACHTCPAPVQAKLTISQPGDRFEQEADWVADAVMAMPEPRNGQRLQRECSECDDEVHRQPVEEEEEEETMAPKLLQRQVEGEEEEEEEVAPKLIRRQVEGEEEEEEEVAPKLIRRQVEGEEEEEEEETARPKAQSGRTPQVTPEVTANIKTLRSGGQPLPDTTRAFFEPRFGHDFSRVRVHADAKAVDTAQAVQARAFTVGRDVVFGAGQYAPDTSGGRRLLAHELAHVVQQDSNSTVVRRVEVQDCDPKVNPQQKPKTVQEAHELAKSMLQNAISLSSASAPDPQVFAPAKRFFKIKLPASTKNDKEQWSHISNALATMVAAYKDAVYECEPKEELSHGLCKPGRYGVSLWNIHLCPVWFNYGKDIQAAMLLHEWGHKWGEGINRILETYCTEAKYKALSSDDLIKLPDAYMSFIYMLYTGKTPWC